MEYDKKILSANINFLLKEKDKRAIDLDEAIHKSAGYSAKIFGDDNPTNPSIDTVVDAAIFLGTSITSLLFSNFASMSPSEKFVSSFVSKLTNQTASGELSWDQQSKQEIENTPIDALTKTVYHPLLTAEIVGNELKTAYYSLFEPGVRYALNSNVYIMKLTEYTSFYLSRITYADEDDIPFGGDPNIYELYLVNGNTASPICSSCMKGNELFAQQLKELYSLVSETFTHVKLSEATKSILNSFISGKKIEDDIPF